MAKLSEMIMKRNNKDSVARIRNICVIIGCLAEKLAGPNSVCLLTDQVLEYLISNLDQSNNSSIILFSLIALEKFAQTSNY